MTENTREYRYYEELVTRIAGLTYSNIQQILQYENDSNLVDLNLRDITTKVSYMLKILLSSL